MQSDNGTSAVAENKMRYDFLPTRPALNARQFNISRSPKQGGNSDDDSRSYLEELGIEIIENPQPIQFSPNAVKIVHRWSPYVQGFSAQFVQNILDRYSQDYANPSILDPFAGSGTSIVQSKLNNFESYGIELNPLLHFIATAKVSTWDVDPKALLQIAQTLPREHVFHAPSFLKSTKHFNADVLENLEILKSGLDDFAPVTSQEKKIKDLMLLAFSAILIESSNLKRSPCLGYSSSKIVRGHVPFELFENKIREIASDLRTLQDQYQHIRAQSRIWLANSMHFEHPNTYDLIITSPPYMNGLDYVMNYKIEMGWLGFAEGHRQLKSVKDDMVVCDNVSKKLIRDFSQQEDRYNNRWLAKIKEEMTLNIARRGRYRRPDMPEIVHKYFDDMYKVMRQVIGVLRPNGRFILVVGDSLIADTYLPTDLLIAKIGQELGLTIEKIEKARNRRSGQIRSYKLRETIITLHKEG